MKRPTENARGFTIVEILIALIIIGVLALILIPVLASRANQARIASCDSDLQTLADAQERAAVDFGYYVRLYALDDLPRGDGVAGGVDGISDEHLNTAFYTNPDRMFIVPNDGQLLSAASSQTLYESLAYETNYLWQGPYYTIHRDETPAEHTPPLNLHDIPNDPWGTDYLFFVREGLVVEPQGEIRTTYTVNGSSYDTRIFDRPTILSLGPDRAPGDGGAGNFGDGDDRYRSFGY